MQPRRPRRGDAVQGSSGRVRSIVVGEGGGRQFRDWEFNEEARTYRKVVLDVDAAAVFGPEASGNSQAQTGSAVIGREMRQEESVLVFWGNAGATVRDADHHGFRIGMG